MPFLATNETSFAVFPPIRLSFEKFDYFLLSLLIHENFVFLLGSWLVAAATIFLFALDLQVILFASLGIFLSVLEDVFKKDLLTTQFVQCNKACLMDFFESHTYNISLHSSDHLVCNVRKILTVFNQFVRVLVNNWD